MNAAAVLGVGDAPLGGFQRELLEVAFDAVSAIPHKPHIRNRSRAQEAVFGVCLELDQPRMATAQLDRIDNWLRGSAAADFAFYCVERGDTSDVERWLQLAARTAADEEDWRRDLVNVKIARVHALLGNHETAAALEASVVDSEAGKVDAVRARLLAPDQFDALFTSLNSTLASGNFDRIRNALDACLALFDRFYADESRRTSIERSIRAAWVSMPGIVRVDALVAMADTARKRSDPQRALDFAREARSLLDAAEWRPEDRIPLQARLARLLHDCRDNEAARRDADDALARFQRERDDMLNIDRAGVLRPIAEAYQAMQDSAAALSVYRAALEAGVENPNSRPRAEDLAATCCSMAANRFEPDGEMWRRIREIRNGLGDPW